MRKILQWLVPFMLACSMNVFATVNDSSTKVAWSYKGNNGPSRWGQLYPGFRLCAEGRDQSTINIKMKKNVKPVHSVLKMHYVPGNMDLTNDVSLKLDLGAIQYIINNGHAIQLNMHGDNKNEWVTFAGKIYKLMQFHFHSPSENQLNSISYPMEIHFVHQGEDGKVLVVGVFVKGGKDNVALEKIISELPKETGKEFAINGGYINPYDLVPSSQDYYSFRGSLTTPPCTEGLQWVVMATPITASPAQIMTMRKAALGENARPVQPLHHRPITYSVEKKV